MAHKVGSDIDAWCTRCRIDTIHVVVSLKADEETAKRAECKSCGGQHNYRPPKTGPNTKTKRATSTTKKSTKKATKKKATKKKTTKRRSTTIPAAPKVDWSDRMAAFQTTGVEPRKYSIREDFDVNDYLDHIKFGKGIVVELVAANKISVLFEDGSRTLIMNRT